MVGGGYIDPPPQGKFGLREIANKLKLEDPMIKSYDQANVCSSLSRHQCNIEGSENDPFSPAPPPLSARPKKNWFDRDYYHNLHPSDTINIVNPYRISHEYLFVLQFKLYVVITHRFC